jgi:flavin reductase (DIM6/NTAB) family NADH-FMN oxidoreductase RutF
MKKEIPLNKANRLINSGAVILVTSISKEGKANIITLAWQMPISHNPPLCAISIAKSHFSHQLIESTREFVINVPNVELLDVVKFCGSVSGKVIDKFKEGKLTPIPAKIVKPPLIKECIGHLECKLLEMHPAGDHTIFIGKIVSALVNKDLFDGASWIIDKEETNLIYHFGGTLFATISKVI